MMGSKQRHFAPLVNVSLEALVPQDHFYRHLERTLDLSFVREFVQETYAGGGRPSIDPVVFFKLQLVMFFEDIRSERLLMRHAASIDRGLPESPAQAAGVGRTLICRSQRLAWPAPLPLAAALARQL
jgi:hypothetical protein